MLFGNAVPLRLLDASRRHLVPATTSATPLQWPCSSTYSALHTHGKAVRGAPEYPGAGTPHRALPLVSSAPATNPAGHGPHVRNIPSVWQAL